MKCCIALFLALIATSSVEGDTIFEGDCPNVEGINEFNETRFKGVWYEIQHFDNTTTEGCGLFDYKHLPNDTNYIYELNSQITTLASVTNSSTVKKLQRFISNKNNGNYTIFINNTKELIGHQVVATDYEKYAIVWGCAANGTNKSIQKLSILGRNSSLTEDILDTVKAELKKTSINSTSLKSVEQDNKKCGRSSAVVLVAPSFISSIIVLLLANKF